jgi:hypothetical protein
MNGKKIKAIQKENEIRKVVIRTQRWRLRIKLLKDNADKQPTGPTIVGPTVTEKRKYNWPVQPNKSWECKMFFFKKLNQTLMNTEVQIYFYITSLNS